MTSRKDGGQPISNVSTWESKGQICVTSFIKGSLYYEWIMGMCWKIIPTLT